MTGLPLSFPSAITDLDVLRFDLQQAADRQPSLPSHGLRSTNKACVFYALQPPLPTKRNKSKKQAQAEAEAGERLAMAMPAAASAPEMVTVTRQIGPDQ